MTIIRCPICDQFLEGDGEGPLTVALREHLSSAHQLHEQHDVLSSTSPLPHQPQEWEEMKREEVLVDPKEGEVGEDVPESVLCPFCGDRFLGHDGEDLTQHLIAHLRDVHGIHTRGRFMTLVR
ncbi:MAG: hypothetical protein SA339_10910 [Methanomassiliicoccus sp.]|nr:hypothetical protein [Methanomassiliicoccus sp.]